MSEKEEEIRGRAYQLWEEAGRPEGRSDDFWLAAEMEILGKIDQSIGQPGERGPPENLLDPLLHRKRDD